MPTFNEQAKPWFETGDYPTEQQFYQVFDWLRWKDEGIGINDVANLQTILNNLQAQLNAITPSKIISGGEVTVKSDDGTTVVLQIPATSYELKGIPYACAHSEISITRPSDPTLSRFDVFYLDAAGFKVLQGTESNSPIKPQLLNGLELTTILVGYDNEIIIGPHPDTPNLQEVTLAGNVTTRPLISKDSLQAGQALTNLTGIIKAQLLTDNRTFQLPDKSGTFAMLDDVAGGGGGGVWGAITGTIADQVDLMSAGKIRADLLPPIAITETFVEASEASMLALSAQTGDVCVRTDLVKTFILKGSNPAVLADWEILLTPPGGVVSVFGRSGAVTAQSGDYSFSQISGTAAANQGGTGLNTFAKGDLIYASAADVLSKLPAGADGKVLTLAGGVPVWGNAASGLPSQTGNAGKVLTTDGSVASWGALTGWTVTGNAGTDEGITNFIGTTDNKDFVLKTNSNNTVIARKGGGITIFNRYVPNPAFGVNIGVVGNTTPFLYISSAGPGDAWDGAAGYGLIFGSPSNEILKIDTNGITAKNLTISSSTFKMPSGGKIDFLSTAIETTSPYIALRYNGVNTWNAAIRNGTTNVFVANRYGRFSMCSTGAASSPDCSLLTLSSTTEGSIPAPRMTNTQWGMIAGKIEGLQAWSTDDKAQLWYDGTGTIGFRYNRGTSKFQGYDGTNWIDLN